MFNKFLSIFSKLSGQLISTLIAGLVIGILGAIGLSSVMSSLLISIVFLVILVNFVKLDREKNNFWFWFKKNLLILIGIYIGVGWLFLTLLGVVGKNGSGSIFTLIAYLMFTPMAVYVARKGN